jgi:hypothetical protein
LADAARDLAEFQRAIRENGPIWKAGPPSPLRGFGETASAWLA